MTIRALSERQRGVAQLLAGSVLISFSAVFVKLAHVPPTTAGVYRNLFGAVTLVLIVLIKREALWKGRTAMFLAVLAGVLFAVDIFCWHRSIHYIGPGLATIMGNFQVFVLAGVGIFIFKERATWRLLVSIPLAVLGLFLLVGMEWEQLDRTYKIGVGLGVLTAITYAGYLLTLRSARMRQVRLSPTANLAVISLVSAALLAVSAAYEGAGFTIPDAQSWAVLVAYGVVCQALGWIIISQGLARVETSRAGLLLLLQPTLTFVWDIVMFSRPTGVIEMFGAALAVGAIHLGNTGRK